MTHWKLFVFSGLSLLLVWYAQRGSNRNLILTAMFVILMFLLPRDTQAKHRIGLFVVYLAMSILVFWWR